MFVSDLVSGTGGLYALAMIGHLRGKVADKNPEGVLIDVGGVGYDVFLPLSTLAGLPQKGDDVSLHIHTHVREDMLKLFGFDKKQDLTAFRTMLKVNGVGPKLALAIIGALSGNQLAKVIEESDVKRLSAIPGIGKKTAERIILELSGKLKLGSDGDLAGGGDGIMSELASALKNLGFRPAQVDRVLAQIRIQNKTERPFEELLKEALGLLQENR